MINFVGHNLQNRQDIFVFSYFRQKRLKVDAPAAEAIALTKHRF